MEQQTNPQNADNKKSDDLIQSDLSGNAFLQTPEEYQKDKGSAPHDAISVSRSADRATDADPFAGSDRAGTAERKSQELEDEE